MSDFYARFEEFCKTPGVDSGKARSYANEIEYLCDYLEIHEINDQGISQIKSLENDVCNKDSELYQDLLHFLTGRGQKSYLAKGYIKAALKYFFEFVK